MKIKLLLLVLLLITIADCTNEKRVSDVTIESAILTAKTLAHNNRFKTDELDVEVMKFKKGVDKGPMRFNLFFRIFSPSEAQVILERDFWLVYLYPKKRSIIGGDYYVLVDLYTGAVIASKAGK